MFTPDDIQARLREKPFRPMRIVTSTGEIYDVYHPDLVLVGRRFLIVGMPSSENATHADAVTRLAMIHVTELRDLPFPANSSNGSMA